MSFEFVTFHSDKPAGVTGAHPNANLEGSLYLRMIDMLFRSARLFHRGEACTLLTDRHTNADGIRGPFHRVDCPIDHATLMLSRSLAQLAYIESSDFARPLLLLDSDVLINGALDSVFAEDFDVALTWRLHKTAPINGGVIVLNNRRPDVVRGFFRRVVATYQEQHRRKDQWFGDQLALRDVVGMSDRDLSRSHIVSIDGCRVLMLPCERYNFSPEPTLSAIGQPLDDKSILHFKGERKPLMERYWVTYLQPRERSWPFSTIARLRARRDLHARMAQAGVEPVRA